MIKRILFIAFAFIALWLALSSCDHRAKVVAPIHVPNLDTLKIYADKATQTADPKDQYFAAEYLLMQYTASDSTKAIALLTKSAEQNYPWAANQLGNIYSADSTDSHYDIQKAIQFYEQGVKNGSDRAMTNLANLYANGNGVQSNLKKAMQLRTDAILGLLKLAEQGNPAAQWRLGCNLYDGTGTQKNEKVGVDWIKSAAEQGYVPAFFSMGAIFANGMGDIPQNLKESFEWYLKGAEKGEAGAMYQVATCYSTGRGADNDLPKAFDWYLKAAELGYPDALFTVALYYQNGNGTDKNYSEAFKWYKKSAERGNTSAMNNIGAMYQSGQGVAKDEQEAFKWFMKAAEKGAAFSQRVVGDCYRDGTGVEVDKTQAFEWYKKAAAQADKTAMHRLGVCYLFGEGVPKDEKLSAFWFDQSR